MNQKQIPLKIRLVLILVLMLLVTHAVNVMLSWNGLEAFDLWRIIAKIEIDGNRYIHNVSADSDIVKDEDTGYYTPLRENLLDLKKGIPEIGDIYVADRNGYIKRDILKSNAPVNKYWRTLIAGNNRIREISFDEKNAVKLVETAGSYYYIISTEDFFNEKEIQHPDNLLIIQINNDFFQKELWRYRLDGLLYALSIALISGCALLVILMFIPLFRDGRMLKANIYAAVFLVFVISQYISFHHVTRKYEDTYISFARELIGDVNRKLHHTVDFLLENKVDVRDKKMMLDDLIVLSKRIEQIESINLFDPAGKLLFSSASLRQNRPVFEPGSIWQDNIPLYERRGGEKITSHTNVTINRTLVRNAIRQYFYNCLTVAIVSMVIQSEFIFLILTIFVRRMSDDNLSDTERSFFHCQQIRFLTFVLFFAMDMAITFVSLYMGEIYRPLPGFSSEFVMALPLSFQIAVSALFTYLAGARINRGIWKQVLVLGIFLLGAGSFFSSMAELPVLYILARGIVGAGFGCCITAIISYLNWNTTEENRAQGFTYYMSGIYAGSISGGTIGAMFADRFDYRFAFVIAGAAFFTIMIVFLLLKSRFDSPFTAQADSESIGKSGITFNDIVSFIRQKRILTTFMAIVPTFIILVGFIDYYMPIFLKGTGFTQSDIGRVNLLYGACITYVSKYIGILIDRSKSSKYCYIAGGLLGIVGLFLYSALGGVLGMLTAIPLMALFSIFANNAGYAYYVESNECKAFGEEKALGIFNTILSAGQMLGPVVFAEFVVLMGSSRGAEVLAIIYLVIMVLFALLATNGRKTA